MTATDVPAHQGSVHDVPIVPHTIRGSHWRGIHTLIASSVCSAYYPRLHTSRDTFTDEGAGLPYSPRTHSTTVASLLATAVGSLPHQLLEDARLHQAAMHAYTRLPGLLRSTPR